MKVTYIAVFEPSSDGGYGVYFPDLPGCASYGRTHKEAVKMAKEALGLHLLGMEEDGDEINPPSSADELEIFEETVSSYLTVPITIMKEEYKYV